MRAGSSQSSSDDDTVSSVSQERISRGRRDSTVRDCAVHLLHCCCFCIEHHLVSQVFLHCNFDGLGIKDG